MLLFDKNKFDKWFEFILIYNSLNMPKNQKNSDFLCKIIATKNFSKSVEIVHVLTKEKISKSFMFYQL